MTTLAFSNPIYDILPCFELQKPDEEINSVTVPVPKPRKSKIKANDDLLKVLNTDNDDDDLESKNGTAYGKRQSYSDFETTMQQIISDLDELSQKIEIQRNSSQTNCSETDDKQYITSSEFLPETSISSPTESLPTATTTTSTSSPTESLPTATTTQSNSSPTESLPTATTSAECVETEYSSSTKSNGRKKIHVRKSIFKFSISSSSEVGSPPPDLDQFDDVCSLPDENENIESPPPELPPRKPPRRVPNFPESEFEHENKQNHSKNDDTPSLPPESARKSPAFSMRINPEYLNLEHLHETKIVLQRSGYLWKTGPNLKNFKLRWCILYRHSLEEADANLSYYFNRGAISASFSGKILLNDIEFLSITETVASKTRLPKTNDDEKVAFLEIGTRPRQGRVYLFAAKSDKERQCWLHSLAQAISLHAFENKDLYFVGFIRAKFTVTAPWHYCFAILTCDRYLYMFQARTQARSNSVIKNIDCKRYHAFNLRKTVKFNILDSKGAPIPVSESTRIVDCRFGFSLTQNGGSVVYIVTDYEHHNARWLRAISHLWSIHDESDRCILNEQYLTKQNIPVAVEKCLQFIETFSQSPSVSALANLDSSEPMSNVSSMSICGQVIGELQRNAWQVHFLPSKFTCQQISLILLLFLRSMNECIFTENQLKDWFKLSELIVNDWNNTNMIRMKELLFQLQIVNYHTLRRLIIHLASFCSSPKEPKLSNFLCKSFLFSKKKSFIVSLADSRNILTKLIQNYIWLFEVSDKELAKEDRIRKAVNMLFNQNKNNSDSTPIYPRIIPSSGSTSKLPSLTSKNVENECKESMKTLIIGVRLFVYCMDEVKQTIINVHLIHDKTAKDVIESILDKDNKDVEIERYSLFEVICANRLERIFMPDEKVLPVVLNWSNWPASWANDACLELRITDSLLPQCSILLERPTSSPNPKMLITVIRYCSNIENRSTKKILVELSNEALLLYTKDTNELIDEFRVSNIYCYFGVESGNLFSGKASIVVDETHNTITPLISASRMRSKTCPKIASRSLHRSSSSKNHNVQVHNTKKNIPIINESYPALTIVPKDYHEQRQCSKRLNFGHTFVFNSWPELEQWFNTILHIQLNYSVPF